MPTYSGVRSASRPVGLLALAAITASMLVASAATSPEVRVVMTTRLMWERNRADEMFGGVERHMLMMAEVGTECEEPMADSVDHESLAAMSLPSLLYYVLFGEGRLVDETG